MAAPVSPQRKAKAAHVLRSRGSWQKAADAAGVRKRQIGRWLKDPDFLRLVHGRGVLQVGPIQIVANHDAALFDIPSEQSQLWIATETREVLGSLIVADASHLRAVFVAARNVPLVRAELEAGRFPILADERSAVLRADALRALTDEDELALLVRLFTAPPRESFAAWLGVWKFGAGETKDVRDLSELWEGQARLADVLCEQPHTYVLKARKLGFTEISVAFAGYCARVRDLNARVHLFSYRERAALELLAKVRFGLENLPEYLRLPLRRETLKELEYDAGHDDVRAVVAFPTSDSTAVEATSTHAMLDEFADVPRNETVYGSLEPTFSAPGATSEIVTTGKGPADWSADYWRRCKDGDGLHVPVFVPATARPGRDEKWLAAKRRTMTKQSFRCEYALEESDALAGSQGFFFAGEDVDWMAQGALPGQQLLERAEWENARRDRRRPRKLHGYKLITGVDIGVRDATVLVTLLLSGNSDMKSVVGFERYTGLSYPAIQKVIERKALEFPRAPIAIEQNSMGITVIQNLNVPARQIIPFMTNASSKARALESVQYALENQLLKAHPDDCPQLFRELRDYQIPDEHVVQDSVMALAIACDSAAAAYRKLGIVHPHFFVD